MAALGKLKIYYGPPEVHARRWREKREINERKRERERVQGKKMEFLAVSSFLNCPLHHRGQAGITESVVEQ